MDQDLINMRYEVNRNGGLGQNATIDEQVFESFYNFFNCIFQLPKASIPQALKDHYALWLKDLYKFILKYPHHAKSISFKAEKYLEDWKDDIGLVNTILFLGHISLTLKERVEDESQ